MSTSITDILISGHRFENISVWKFCKNISQYARDFLVKVHKYLIK